MLRRSNRIDLVGDCFCKNGASNAVASADFELRSIEVEFELAVAQLKSPAVLGAGIGHHAQ